ncbi:MAG: hypothetical protein ACO1NX_08460 [Chitinophagaceae bacterium]
MYQISLWARHHIWATRFLFVVLYLIINLTGWLLGEQLAAVGIYLTQTHFYLGTALLLAGFFAYPSKKGKRNFRRFYSYQKSCDMALITGTFVVTVCLAQPQSLPPAWLSLSHPAYATEAATAATEKPAAQQKKSIFRKLANGAIQWLGIDRAIQKKVQKNWQRLQKEYKASTEGEKIALIILSVLVAIALLGLVGAVACDLSCSGSDGAAVLVAVLGTGLIIFLLVKVIQRINRGPKWRRQQQGAEPPPSTTRAF